MNTKRLTMAQAIIAFLKNLQALRSTGVAHRKGCNYEKIAASFGLGTLRWRTACSGC